MAVKKRQSLGGGGAIKLARGLRGWTQVELAREAGLSSASISEYEREAKAPTGRSMGRIAAALGFSVIDLASVTAFVCRFQGGRRDTLAPVQRSPGEWTLSELAGRLGASLAPEIPGVQPSASRFADGGPAWKGLAALWRRVEAESADEVAFLLRSDISFHDPHFCAFLCEKSIEAAGRNAMRALELSRWSLIVAELGFCDEPYRARCTGYARAHLANALRVGGDIRKADATLAGALGLWRQGRSAASLAFLDEARVLAIEASLRREQRRLSEALRLFDAALAIDRWGNTASLLIGKAKAVEESGRYDEALALLVRASFHLAGDAQPEKLFFVRKNAAVALCHLGRHAEAQRLLPEIAAMAARLEIGGLELLRLRWLSARVAAGTGHPVDAVATLDFVRSEFMKLGIGYDAALVTLELAEIHAALGDIGRVASLARASVRIFHDQGVHREAQRALTVFCRAAEQEGATADFLRQMVGYLYRARQDPKLRFGAALPSTG